MPSAAAVPDVGTEYQDIQQNDFGRLYQCVLLDDDEHTYDYVIEMLQKLFFISAEAALQHAIEVSDTGRSVIITCEREQAEFARDQIHAFGADPRMPVSKGSMSAIVVPAPGTKGG